MADKKSNGSKDNSSSNFVTDEKAVVSETPDSDPREPSEGSGGSESGSDE